MTLNFIDVEDLRESMEELEYCCHLQEIYLTGNPCTEWKDYIEYVIAKLPQLIRINGDDITKSQRLAAKAKLTKLEDDLEVLAKDSIEKKEFEKKEGTFNPDKWSPENRWRDYVEERDRKEAEEKKRKEETMFKDYNDIVDEEKKAVSNLLF